MNDMMKRLEEIENFETIATALEKAASDEEIKAILKENGIAETEEEYKQFAGMIKQQDEALSEDDLESVTGGIGSLIKKLKEIVEYGKKAYRLGKKFRDWVDSL